MKVKQLRVVPDERGRLMEIVRCDDEHFTGFGQVYMTTAYPGVVKGWHYHLHQEDNLAVVEGTIKLVLYDRRDESPTHGQINEFFLGEHRPLLVHIPAGVVHGFKAIGAEEAIIVNTVTQPCDYEQPDEFRMPPHSSDISYDWSLEEG